jgi:hypothetical protein
LEAERLANAQDCRRLDAKESVNLKRPAAHDLWLLLPVTEICDLNPSQIGRKPNIQHVAHKLSMRDKKHINAIDPFNYLR